MSDNTTLHLASDYEQEVRHTIPFHASILDQAIDSAFALIPRPARWLDTGCGPGRLVALARRFAVETDFFLADPSSAMLDLARGINPDIPGDRFFLAASDALPELPSFDIITAVQCHHYYADPAGRVRALERCRSLLAPGGALVIFENVRAETPLGHAHQRRRWSAWLHAQGRDEAMVTTLLGREDTKFFPLRVSEHMALLGQLGFGAVELIYRAYGQAGFLAIAPS